LSQIGEDWPFFSAELLIRYADLPLQAIVFKGPLLSIYNLMAASMTLVSKNPTSFIPKLCRDAFAAVVGHPRFKEVDVLLIIDTLRS
jgi:hypothetical protein